MDGYWCNAFADTHVLKLIPQSKQVHERLILQAHRFYVALVYACPCVSIVDSVMHVGRSGIIVGPL